MIITRSWLQEFIDLSDVSNEKLYETFNRIGLEVDSMNEISIAEKVVVGKILSCEKHPDADKLNVCQIDVGSGTRQIVCGASNVVDATYVAVATIGAVLPGDFEIKDAKLRGIESAGMICASSELGLPDMGKGIMILDESIGSLEVGRALSTYDKLADTVIALELTANRGDCLSVYGVARDLSSALDIEMKASVDTYRANSQTSTSKVILELEGEIEADLSYHLLTPKNIKSVFLMQLRLAMVGLESKGHLHTYLAYTTHATGVILRAYESSVFYNAENNIVLSLREKAKGIVEIFANTHLCSVVGVYQDEDTKATDAHTEILLEASYIHPDTLVEAVSNTALKTDDLYYKTSRGSNPALAFGFSVLASLFHTYSDVSYEEHTVSMKQDRKNETVEVSATEISSIIGMEVSLAKIETILEKLDFDISKIDADTLRVSVPLFRHDIKHIQDIAEEIVRIIGIHNIPAKALKFVEKQRLNATTAIYKVKKAFKNRAVGAGFYQNVSYVFSDKALLEKYGFTVTEDALALSNPIAEELNTLRSTVLVNILNAVKRNVSYSKKHIPLFEIGAVFGSKREQKEVISFVFSGQCENEHIYNAGKPAQIDFAKFTQKVAAVIGAFDLEPCTYKNAFVHPYQSANVLVGGHVCGFISKLHPSVQEAYGIPVTFIAELDFDILLPAHINARPISKFQGVYKDLSIVIDQAISYYEVAKVLHRLNINMLQDVYPVDIYTDETLGDKKSLTIRCFIQSMDKTLEEKDIDSVMQRIMSVLASECNAQLR